MTHSIRQGDGNIYTPINVMPKVAEDGQTLETRPDIEKYFFFGQNPHHA